MNPAFERALKARFLWLQVRSYGSLGFHRLARQFAQEAYRIVEELAVNQARCVPPDAAKYGAESPIVINDVSRLSELYEQTWHEEACAVEEERQVFADHLKREQKKAHALGCIERNDWEALDLPSPEHLSTELYSGKLMSVGGHTLDFEEGVVWMDNPYGVPGALGEEPTIQLCRQFLKRIALGGMYGPEP